MEGWRGESRVKEKEEALFFGDDSGCDLIFNPLMGVGRRCRGVGGGDSLIFVARDLHRQDYVSMQNRNSLPI